MVRGEEGEVERRELVSGCRERERGEEKEGKGARWGGERQCQAVGCCHGDWCEDSVCSDAKSEIAPGQGTATLINFYVISATRGGEKTHRANKGTGEDRAIEGKK